jgi:peptide/nickel transport system substrate-binding protein
LLCLAACRPTAVQSKNVPQEITIAYPEGTGITARSGIRQVTEALSQEGLTQLTPEGQAMPRLAESWHWDSDLELRLRLRPGITLHDHRKLNAETLAEMLRTAIADEGQRQFVPGLTDIKEVVPDGELDLLFKLFRHSSWLPEDLSMPIATGKDPALGTGPYRVVQFDATGAVLERYDAYYRGKPTIARVIVRPADTQRVAWASLLRGSVDMVTDLPPDTVELIRNDNVRIMSFLRRYQYLIGFNGRIAKLADPRVRRALNLAIDREGIVKNVLKGSGIAATGPIWPKHWAYDSTAGQFDYDPRGAERLLSEAGLPMRPSADPALPPARLRMKCLIPDTFIVYEQVAREVQRELSEVGVDLRFDVQPVSLYNAQANAGDFECVFADLISGPSLSRASLFWRSLRHKDAATTFGYENPATEKLFEEIRLASDDLTIRRAARQLQQAFLANPPGIFIAWNERTRAVRGDFQVVLEPGTDPLPTLWEWGSEKPVERLAAR